MTDQLPDAPNLEQARLLRKGQRLYGRCLRKHDTLCVTAFVDYQLAQGNHALIRAYRDWLASQQLPAPDAQHLTADLLTAINGRLSHE